MKSLENSMRTLRRILLSFSALAMFTSVAGADAVAGKESAVPGGGKTVTQEVLEILKRSGTISAAKYKTKMKGGEQARLFPELMKAIAAKLMRRAEQPPWDQTS